MDTFYVSIPTIQSYKPALDLLLSSLPQEWKNKYIIIYQKEEREEYKIYEDGHIEVKIKQNLHDYGNWVGIHLLIKNDIIPKDAWFLFIHDTCKFGKNSVQLTTNIVNKFNETDIDIVWLCNTGQCNICFIRRNAIVIGYELYKNIDEMTKMETIEYEWKHDNPLSPKSFDVKQHFLQNNIIHLGLQYVYNNTNNRNVVLYDSINIEKYYFFTLRECDHPKAP